jgi:hypothetical protein
MAAGMPRGNKVGWFMMRNTRLRVKRVALMARLIVLTCCALVILSLSPMNTRATEAFRVAAGPSDQPPHALPGDRAPAAPDEPFTPEQKMQRRFPQPVRVGDLLGLPVLDDNDSTIGYVRQVTRMPDGKIALIVPYSAWFGWMRTDWGKRPVAVPIEAVAILARQLDSLDMSREDFDEAITWTPTQGQVLGPDEMTPIGLGRR